MEVLALSSGVLLAGLAVGCWIGFESGGRYERMKQHNHEVMQRTIDRHVPESQPDPVYMTAEEEREIGPT